MGKSQDSSAGGGGECVWVCVLGFDFCFVLFMMPNPISALE